MSTTKGLILNIPALSILQVLKMVRAGYRLEPLMGCPEDVFALLKTCWEEARDKRPTFAALLTATQALMDKYATDAADRCVHVATAMDRMCYA